MIKANELRIGDWVTEYGNYLQISLNNGDLWHSDNFDSIPLTPEILKKCGFEKDTNKSWITKQTDFISINENGTWVNENPVSEIKYVLYKKYAGAIVEVKYLHKLQNIFFDIVDEELNINL